ncbi:MAG: DUF4176 domain-containing protein [Clostridia bacterium]|nr:DUF4176 domain-containing protein [Clostridia bacterium]
MLASEEYLPIGSVVLLKDGLKKAMVIGIMQSRKNNEEVMEEYDYIGVVYPEGFMNLETMLLFNHDQINDIVFKGYENPERKVFVDFIDKVIKKSGSL